MSRKVQVTKITKQGFGRKIGSEFGYSSFEIAPTAIEISLDPPIDLNTSEGKEAYEKMKKILTRMTVHILEEDVKYYSERNDELRMSLEKKGQQLSQIMGTQ